MKAHNFLYYWSNCIDREDQDEMAEACKVQRTWLVQIAGGYKTPSDGLVRRMIEYDKNVDQLWFVEDK